MEDTAFRDQIKEDIEFYQLRHPHVPNIDKPEWAFNYWVLDKLFGEDEDVIVGNITDYSDNGIDCYVWHEDSRDLFLIQNKYYTDNSSISTSYFNNVVQEAYGQLLNGTYKRSHDLQIIFNKYHDDPDFYVYHYFYVTNNERSAGVEDALKSFNARYRDNRRMARVFYLEDIQEAFYGEPIHEKPHFTAELETLNKGTALNILNKEYGLGFEIDAKYIMLPVATLFKMIKQAEQEHYPIFDANIREYLGSSKPINKKIIKTLQNTSERKRFFFYNNGITIICTKINQHTKGVLHITLEDPQIVNGCQTVSSIKHVLDAYPEREINKEFDGVYVMAKVLVIPDNNEVDIEDLRKNIVRYNNSQNGIDEKDFTANQDLFRTVQTEFEKRGFLVLIKQSDRAMYSEKYEHRVSLLLDRSDEKLKQFGLEGKLTKVRDFMVPLDKLLQVFLAFSGDAQQAFQKKSKLLDEQSPQWAIVTDAIKTASFTTQSMLDLYLLYLRSERAKNDADGDGKIPVTWHLIEGFSRYECNGDLSVISTRLNDPEAVNKIISLYAMVTSLYLNDYRNAHEDGSYNKMIKEKLDHSKFSAFRESVKTTIQLNL